MSLVKRPVRITKTVLFRQYKELYYSRRHSRCDEFNDRRKDKRRTKKES
ncbi:hypothetical protein SAMN02910275_01361 [Butyrivibrio sp. INlla18]|nr:hypothetical protein SAMN02910275_01361 [Butyrivibrio sp. INlla18]